MGSRINDLEKSVSDLMAQSGVAPEVAAQVAATGAPPPSKQQ